MLKKNIVFYNAVQMHNMLSYHVEKNMISFRLIANFLLTTEDELILLFNSLANKHKKAIFHSTSED